MRISFLFLIFCSGLSIVTYGQDQYFTKTGVVSFKAGTGAEDIDGLNKSVSSIIDIASGQIEMAILIKAFEFKRGLMQEHFNENYMESDKYPKATFKGKINEIPGLNLKIDGTYSVHANGILEIHNVKKQVEFPVTLKVANGVIMVDNQFEIHLEDYKIDIPAAVTDKISSKVIIQLKAEYRPLKTRR
jgi:hypothetical protein